MMQGGFLILSYCLYCLHNVECQKVEKVSIFVPYSDERNIVCE